MKPQTVKKKKKKIPEKENLTDVELQKQLYPGLAMPNDPELAKVN